ncbi:STAS domain-containing protein [Rhodococcus sp. P1Y]|uniref:STAS domain-containing protein n=1 Tax=Rhodococcus sp. P1Y TaxID=1302308 RepID=UPI000EAF4C79|nr:STAS domain-containing protein [Rhodococcus sp. P1Y]AYJ48139.1 anti-sigma factor antagonist [Rhodococcus sp. P1Y]
MITATNPLSIDSFALPPELTSRFTIETESYSAEFAILRVAGDLDITARAELVDSLDQLVGRGSDVLVDLSGVSFMYSGAANAVIDAASASTADVRIFAPTRPVRMILDVLGAGSLLVDSGFDRRAAV